MVEQLCVIVGATTADHCAMQSGDFQIVSIPTLRGIYITEM